MARRHRLKPAIRPCLGCGKETAGNSMRQGKCWRCLKDDNRQDTVFGDPEWLKKPLRRTP